MQGIRSEAADGIRTHDLRVVSPNLEIGGTTWGTVSSGFREIEIGWNLWSTLPRLLPQRRVARFVGTSARRRELSLIRRVAREVVRPTTYALSTVTGGGSISS